MQLSLDNIPQTERLRLETKRMILYKELLQELATLTQRRITLVKTYNAKVHDIDVKLKRIVYKEKQHAQSN